MIWVWGLNRVYGILRLLLLISMAMEKPKLLRKVLGMIINVTLKDVYTAEANTCYCSMA
jgi:hypothetical protein